MLIGLAVVKRDGKHKCRDYSNRGGTTKDRRYSGRLTTRLSIDQWRQLEEQRQNPSAWSKIRKSRKKYKNSRKAKRKLRRQWQRFLKANRDPEIEKLRATPEYKEWRIAVLERDGYRCQHCEKVGKRLHAHHIKSFKMYPELRYKVENGITLCAACHEELHIKRLQGAKIIKLSG